MAHRLRTRGLWRCATCRYQASLTAGTPFHGTRVPLRTWFLAMFSYRFDRRWREDELFGFVLRRVVRGQPLPYRRLVAERTA